MESLVELNELVLLALTVGRRFPITDANSAGRLPALDYKSLHRAVRVDIGTLQVNAGRYGARIINTIREQEAKVYAVLWDIELDGIAAVGTLEIKSHGWREITRVADRACDSAVLQLLCLCVNIHIEGLVCAVSRSEQSSGRVSQHPVTRVMTGSARSS